MPRSVEAASAGSGCGAGWFAQGEVDRSSECPVGVDCGGVEDIAEL